MNIKRSVFASFEEANNYAKKICHTGSVTIRIIDGGGREVIFESSVNPRKLPEKKVNPPQAIINDSISKSSVNPRKLSDGILESDLHEFLNKLQAAGSAYHKSWGRGKIIFLNNIDRQILINFRQKPRHTMDFAMAAKCLTPCSGLPGSNKEKLKIINKQEERETETCPHCSASVWKQGNHITTCKVKHEVEEVQNEEIKQPGDMPILPNPGKPDHWREQT